MNKPACLHISTLYEGKPAMIAWPEVPGATGYILERRLGSVFDSPAVWLDIETDSLTWNDLESESFDWQALESHAAITVVYNGADGNVDATHKEATWLDVSCAFPTWENLDAADITWQEFERAHGTGLSWQDAEFSFSDWDHVSNHEISWDTVEKLSCDFILASGHIACTDCIPMDIDTVAYRVKAYDDSQQSDYFTGGMAAVYPRIKTGQSIDFRIPALYEDKATAISWSPVQGATGYRLEGRFNEVFSAPFHGLDWLHMPLKFADWDTLEANGAAWQDVESLTPHFILYEGKNTAHTLVMPTGASSVTLRVTAYNEIENTAFFYSDEQKITPRLLRKDKLSLPIEKDERYLLSLMGKAVDDFPPYLMTITYHHNELKLVNFAAQTAKKSVSSGKISATDLEIMSHENGVIKFVSRKPVQDGRQWSGLVTLLAFIALKNTSTQIELC